MKYFIGVLLIVAGQLFGYSQECQSTLSGKVLDLHDGSALVNAIIKVVNSDRFTYTDLDGSFKLDQLCDGPLDIQVIHPQCEKKIITISISGNTYKEILLEHHVEELQGVTVTGARANLGSKTVQEQELKTAVLEKYSAVSLGDALKQVSGVSSLNTGNTIVKPVIQGLHSSRVLVLNNGTRMEDQEWGVEHAPNIDLNSAGSLTVVKGASALQYSGDAIGGVVIAEAEKIPVKDTLYGKTILTGDSNGRGGTLTSSLTKSYANGWYASVQGTLKKYGDFEAPDYVLSNTGTEEKDFTVRFGLHKFDYGAEAYYSYYNNTIGILRASHIGNVNDLINAINNREPSYIRDFGYSIAPPHQEVVHQLAHLKFYKRFEDLGLLNVQYDFQQNNRREYDLRVGDDKGKPSVDLRLTTHSLATDFKLDPNSNYNLHVGLNGMYQVNFPDPATGVRRLIPDYKKYALGGFVVGNVNLSDQLLLESGLRYDYTHVDAQKYYLKARWEQKGYDEDFSNIIVSEASSQYLTNPVFDYGNFSFTSGLKYSFGTGYQVRFNYGMANRPPNPAELFSDGLHHSSAVIELGDLRLDSERSHKFSLDFQKQLGRFNYAVNLFYNPIQDFIYIQPTGVESTIRGAFPVYEFRQANALLLGTDLDASYRFSPSFRYNGRFSYVKGTNRETDEPLVDIPSANTYNAITYTNTDWHQFEATLRTDWVFEQHEYPNNNFYYDVLKDGEYQSTLVDISTPPASYFLTGLDAYATFHPFKSGAMRVGFSVNNLFNVSYRDYLNRLRFYADNSGRNITLQVKLNY